MQGPILKAVCVFQVLQLIFCIKTQNWECGLEGLFGDKDGCTFKAYSETQELVAVCLRNDSKTLTKSISTEEHFSLNQNNIPSLKELWDQCKYSGEGAISVDNFLEITVMWTNTGMKMLPDEFFCDWSSITMIVIAEHFLPDSTKLGFRSLQQCETRCITNISSLHVIENTFTKVMNDSFCGLDQLTVLYMKNGQIREVESDAFVHLTSLQNLSLENNHISILRPGVFRKQENLRHLDLAGNLLNSSSVEELMNLKQLQYLFLNANQMRVLPVGIFDGMSQLKYLWLGQNFLTTLHGALANLTNLQSLSFSRNLIKEILSGDFGHLIHLESIYLYDNPIIEFESDIFINCHKLTDIIFSNSSLSTVPPFITKSRHLKELDLSYNKFDEIEIGAFDEGQDIDLIDLSFNNLTEITNVFTNCTVKHLKLDHNRLTKLSFTDFSFKLIDLSITHNLIHTINSGFDLLKQSWALKSLNLSHNQFKTMMNLNLPQSLSILDLRNNTIEHMSYTDNYTQVMLINSNGISQLYLQNNAFKVICPQLFFSNKPLESHFDGNPLICSCENQWLSMPFQHKYLKQTIVVHLDTLTCQHEFQRFGMQSHLIMTLAKRHFLCSSTTGSSCTAQTYNQSHYINPIHVKCTAPCKCYNNFDKRIIHIDCSSKNINTLPLTPTVQFKNVQELYAYFDDNSIYKIHSNSFLGLNKTIELYFMRNSLSEMEDGSFDQLTVLSILHLDYNSLRYISDKIFKGLSSLTQLFLSHNQIQTVEPNAFPSQLQTLYLDNNQLVNYSVWYLQNLTEFNLQENKWSCECPFIEKLRNWLLDYPDGSTMLKALFCVLPSGKVRQMSLFNLTSEHCYNETAVNVLPSDKAEVWMWVLGVFICLTIISIFIFIFRREAQVLIYSRMGFRLFYGGEKDELEGKYFDAFIAYSCVDEDFLVNILMPGLEGIDEPYKLCLHHRNFLGGASIINSIMEAVQFSTRTIILLSDNFMRSEWCRFEFQQAYIQMLKDRCNRLLVIIIDEVPADLDPEMRLYLRTNTYLKWGDRLFWKKLYFAMPERVEPRLAERRLAQQQRLAQLGIPHEHRFTHEELPMQIME